jgi:hypothetical protein
MDKSKHKKPKHDWEKIRLAYLQWPQGEEPSEREISRNFKVARETLRRRIKKNDWPKQRDEYWAKVRPKLDQEIADEQAKEIARTIEMVNAIDVLNGYYIKNIQAELKAIMAIPDPIERTAAVNALLERKEVRNFIGTNVIDKNARLKKFLRGEADTHVEVSDRDKRMARAYWKAHRELLEQELTEQENND